jgi:hypothetical protein
MSAISIPIRHSERFRFRVVDDASYDTISIPGKRVTAVTDLGLRVRATERCDRPLSRRHVGRQAAYVTTELLTLGPFRSLLNVPFQSPIRAFMLPHAACSARSPLCGESATRSSSNSRPMGP